MLDNCLGHVLTAQAFCTGGAGCLSTACGSQKNIPSFPNLLIPTSTVFFVGCLETLSHLWILSKTSWSLIPSNLCSLLRTETETVPDFRHSCCHRPVFKGQRQTLLLPCQPSIHKNDQSNLFLSKNCLLWVGMG